MNPRDGQTKEALRPSPLSRGERRPDDSGQAIRLGLRQGSRSGGICQDGRRGATARGREATARGRGRRVRPLRPRRTLLGLYLSGISTYRLHVDAGHLRGETMHTKELRDRIAKYTHVNPDTGCHEWTAGTDQDGYSQTSIGGRTVRAHRVAYEMAKGPIPEGLQIDHLCRVRHCVNPGHLEAVTQQENIRRGEAGQHMRREGNECPSGHPMEGSNLYVEPTGRRRCRECGREKVRRYRERNRGR